MTDLTRRAFLAVVGLAAAGVAALGRSPAVVNANSAGRSGSRNRRGMYSATYLNVY